jgi:hypothetical protein
MLAEPLWRDNLDENGTAMLDQVRHDGLSVAIGEVMAASMLSRFPQSVAIVICLPLLWLQLVRPVVWMFATVV